MNSILNNQHLTIWAIKPSGWRRRPLLSSYINKCPYKWVWEKQVLRNHHCTSTPLASTLCSTEARTALLLHKYFGGRMRHSWTQKRQITAYFCITGCTFLTEMGERSLAFSILFYLAPRWCRFQTLYASVMRRQQVVPVNCSCADQQR